MSKPFLKIVSFASALLIFFSECGYTEQFSITEVAYRACGAVTVGLTDYATKGVRLGNSPGGKGKK